jgi:N4-gp56 family major capsid protein
MAATNVASSFSSDVSKYIQEETLPIAIRQIVAYQFGDPLELPKGRGTTYYATQYNRLNLPYGPLLEGVASVGETIPIAQVSATAQQWGDSVYITDVAELTIMHPLFKKAIELTALQLIETLERNTFNTLMAGTKVFIANGKASRASLATTDVMTMHEVNRQVGSLLNAGAPRFMGDERPDMKLDADQLQGHNTKPAAIPHYAGIVHPLVAMNMREDSTILQAWTYSDVNKVYNSELGPLNNIRFVQSNLVPNWTGVAQVNGTAGSAGNLATGTYYIQVTGMLSQTQQETLIYQVSSSISVTGPNGSISLTLPSTAGYVYNVYVGTASPPVNLGVSASGPSTGSYAGQSVQLNPGATVVITNVGTAQVPPAAPATGVTVYPTFVIGRGAYGQVLLDNAEFNYLSQADKSDPHNQLRVVAWKVFYGTIILNNTFFLRTESGCTFTA